MRKNVQVFAFVFLALSLPAAFYLNRYGYTEDTMGPWLRFTARLALLIYLLIFVARPLQQLRPGALSRWLVRNRRYIGITFASVMSVHLVLLITLNGLVLDIPGILAFTLIFAMLVTSFDKPTAALGPKRWRLLHKTGLYFIGIIFTVTVVTGLNENRGELLHAVLAALLLAAMGVRIAAWLKGRRRVTTTSP